MNILGIETSCDETAIALVNFRKEKNKQFPEIKVLANELASQIKLHAAYGGVVPGLAAREHVKNTEILLKKIKKERKDLFEEIDLIAVTSGPGLMPCLLVGTSFAKALALKHKKPIVGINHLEGHLYSGLIEKKKKNLSFPALGLIVSGGHTELILVKGINDYELIGETLDDAAGEAFDKVARLLGLTYPGGPAIEESAKKGNPTEYDFPRPMIKSGDFNFSFSGLKTAVLYKTQELGKKNDKDINNLAASFQQAVIDVLIQKTKRAIKEFKVKTILSGGGVLANQSLRQSLKNLSEEEIQVLLPAKEYCGDNALIICLAAYLNYSNQKDLSFQKIIPDPNLDLN